ncbi:MAG: BatD family protein [Alphaproteobacteria bacterium]|nr:BatD family protein [Alphaproteobacteria bacterium]MBN2780321.1 BatD family protein [Alphaproteobacteria bacterium]
MRRSIRFFFLISTLFLSIAFSAHAESLSVDLSARHVAVGEPFTITLTYVGNNPDRFGEPDLSSLYKDFEFRGKEQSFEAKEAGAAYLVELKLAYTLIPKREGTFKIPSFYAGNNEFTQPYEIFVGDYFNEGQKNKGQEVVAPSAPSHSTDWSFMIGSVLFIAGGLLFLLSGLFMVLRFFEKAKKSK